MRSLTALKGAFCAPQDEDGVSSSTTTSSSASAAPAPGSAGGKYAVPVPLHRRRASVIPPKAGASVAAAASAPSVAVVPRAGGHRDSTFDDLGDDLKVPASLEAAAAAAAATNGHAAMVASTPSASAGAAAAQAQAWEQGIDVQDGPVGCLISATHLVYSAPCYRSCRREAVRRGSSPASRKFCGWITGKSGWLTIGAFGGTDRVSPGSQRCAHG